MHCHNVTIKVSELKNTIQIRVMLSANLCDSLRHCGENSQTSILLQRRQGTRRYAKRAKILTIKQRYFT